MNFGGDFSMPRIEDICDKLYPREYITTPDCNVSGRRPKELVRLLSFIQMLAVIDSNSFTLQISPRTQPSVHDLDLRATRSSSIFVRFAPLA